MKSFLKKSTIYLIFFIISFIVSIFNDVLGIIFYFISTISFLIYLLVSLNYLVNDKKVNINVDYDIKQIEYLKNGLVKRVDFDDVIFINKIQMNYYLHYIGLVYDFYYFELVFSNGDSFCISYFEVENFSSVHFNVKVKKEILPIINTI